VPARPSFARFVAIDWSGARAPVAQRQAIVRCVVERRDRETRVVCLAGGRDREETVAWLAEQATDGVRTLAGLDFPFAYAAVFLDHLGVRDFPGLLTFMAALDGPPSPAGRVREFVATCGEWWARDGPGRDPRTRRQVECLPGLRGAESPLRALPQAGGYGFVGARQVGKAAITGIAAIAALKARVPSVRVWPFEPLGGASLVLAEIWPRLALGTLTKRDRDARRRKVRELRRRGVRLRSEHARLATASDHAIDALAAAAEMASGRWPLSRSSALPPGYAREGWILGVEPNRPRDPRDPPRRKEQA
jgi:hypothetical protein